MFDGLSVLGLVNRVYWHVLSFIYFKELGFLGSLGAKETKSIWNKKPMNHENKIKYKFNSPLKGDLVSSEAHR
jgi:hypothetical protein